MEGLDARHASGGIQLMANRYTRRVGVELDQQSINAFRAEMAQGFARAAAESGDKVYDGLKGAFDKVKADLKVDLARGVIDEKEFRARSRAASEALAGEMDKAKRAGKLTDQEYVKLSRTLQKVGREGARSLSMMDKAALSLKGALGAAAVAAAGLFSLNKLRQWGIESVKNARDAEMAAARIEAVWRSTGNAVGKSVSELLALSRQLQKSTLFGGEEIEESMAQLLTYKSIAGDTFDRTIRLAMDMSSVFGGLSTSTQALAKALDDPIRGLDSLRKSGFTFEESVLSQVEALMKQNRQLEAQTVLLSALEGEVGGVAEGMKTGLSAAMDDAAKAAKELKDATGKLFGQILLDTGIIDALTTSLQHAARAMERLERVSLIVRGAWAAFRRDGVAAAAAAQAIAAMDAERDRRAREALLEDERRRFGGGKPAAAPLTPEQLRALRDEREKALDAEVAALKRGHDLRILTAREVARAVALEQETRRALDAGNLSLERRNKLTERLNTLRAVTPDTQVRAGVVSVSGPDRGEDNPIAALATQAVPIHKRAAVEVISTWTDAFDMINDSMYENAGIAAQMYMALEEGGIKGVARFASAKAKEAMANAVGEAARGLAALANPFAAALKGESAAGHFAAAGKFSAEAAAWKALGGGGGGGVSAARTASMGGPGRIGGSSADRAQPATAETHIYIDPLSASDPRVVQMVAGAQAKADRYGASVHVHPYPRGRS
jgi:hypothetical protein